MDVKNINFKGTTKCYLMTDIHQEARKFAEFLNHISRNSENTSNVLFLNNGDLFGGIYSRTLTKNLLIDFKKKNPHIEIVTTLGNNDFISEPGCEEPTTQNNPQTQNEFFRAAVTDFSKAGIKVVCANIRDKNGNMPDCIKPYTVVNRDMNRILITGYCINRKDKSVTENYDMLEEEETINELKKAIEKEKPDAVILLNHDYQKICEKLQKYAKEKGIKIDFTVGGHDHEHSYHNPQERIFQPAAFAREMFTFRLKIPSKQQKSESQITDFMSVKSTGQPLEKDAAKVVGEQEKLMGLNNVVTPLRQFNLTTRYAHPNPLGTFVADSIKEKTDALAGFVIGSAIRSSIDTSDAPITQYDTKSALPRETTKVSVVKLTVDELKEYLNNSVKGIITKGEENSNFVQCSSNVKIVADKKDGTDELEIKELYIDGKNIFDEKDKNKTFVFAIDSFSSRFFEHKEDMSYNLRDALEEKLQREIKTNIPQTQSYPVFKIEYKQGGMFI